MIPSLTEDFSTTTNVVPNRVITNLSIRPLPSPTPPLTEGRDAPTDVPLEEVHFPSSIFPST